MRRPPRRARPASRPRARPAAGLRAALGTALVVGASASAGAQAAGEAPAALDVGLTRIRQAGTAPLLAPSVGASWRARRGRGAAGGAAVAAAGDGRVAAQLAFDGARAFGAARAPREVTAEVRGARVPNTPWAAQLQLGVRQHATWAGGGAWASAQGGLVRQAGAAWPSAGAEAGLWARAGAAGRVALTATAAAARVEERGLVAAGVDAYGPARVRTGDVVASYARAAARAEVAVWLGARGYAPGGLRALPADVDDPAGPGPALRWRGVAAVTATAWVLPSLGITAGAGVLPNDLVRGLPAARHVVFALRMRARPRPAGPAPARAAGAAGPELRVDDGGAAGADAGDGAGTRVVRVAAPGAARVRLRADATGWRAVELARGADGAWAVALPLAPGTHRVHVRVDEGPWRAPANLPSVADDLGGTVGLLVVP